MVQGERFGQAGHESLPGRLVPPVAQRFAKVSKPAGVEGADQKERPLKVEDRVAEADGLRKDLPRCRRFKLGLGSADDELQVVGPVPGASFDPAVVELTAQGKATEKRRGCVVGVALDLGRERQQLGCLPRRGNGLIQAKSGNGRSGAASEARAHRDVGAHFDDEARRSTAKPFRRKTERTFDPVLADERRSTDEGEHELSGRSGPQVHDVQPEIQLDGHREGVETWSEIGNRPRHGNLATGAAQ